MTAAELDDGVTGVLPLGREAASSLSPPQATSVRPIATAADGVRGEITLVVAGASPQPTADADPAALAGQVAELEAAGTPRKAAIAAVATKAGIQKRQVYDAVHRNREAPASPPRQ